MAIITSNGRNAGLDNPGDLRYFDIEASYYRLSQRGEPNADLPQATPRMPPIRLTRDQTDDLAAVCSIGAEALGRVAVALTSLGPTIRRANLRQAITQQVGKEAAQPLERFLFGLTIAQRRGAGVISDMLDVITAGIASQKWDEQQISQWKDSRPIIEQLLKSPSVVVAAKAIDLSYDFARLFMAGRVITDIRPVFDDRHEDIVGASITQTLRIDYQTSDGTEETISLAMDVNDLKELIRSCEGALDKGDKARRMIEKDCKKDTITMGEEQNE